MEALLSLGIMALCGLGSLAGTGLFIWMLVSSIKRKGKMGINIQREDCPQCGLALPLVRKPANLRQIMWGGWTCQGCQAELDKWGQPVG